MIHSSYVHFDSTTVSSGNLSMALVSIRENAGTWSSTLDAVRHAYELLGGDLCPTCPRRREESGNGKETWYYMI
jgi:hypothetical protein